MIQPSIYNFNAPYRGPKDSKEIDKLFTSILYDLSTLSTEVALQTTMMERNMDFLIAASGQPTSTFPSAGFVNGEDYNYHGIDTAPGSNVTQERELGLVQAVNSLNMKLNQILKNL